MLYLGFGGKCVADPPDPARKHLTAAEGPTTATATASKESARAEVPGTQHERTYSSLDAPNLNDKESFAAGFIKFQDTDVLEVLKIYQEISHRTVIHSSSLPSGKVSLQNETALNRRELLQVLDTVLSQNSITMIPLGTKFVRAVPAAQAPTEAVPVVELPPEALPDSGSYILYIVEMKTLVPREVAPVLQPFAKMPSSIVPVDSSGLLLLRDYSANIRRMLEVISRLETAQSAKEK
jgi:type II secretory pathway component GspD/PulD (secretin)